MDRFAGRIAVVTGASSGIGSNIAQDLAKAGMVVVGVARRKNKLTELASSLKAAGVKGRLEVVPADLSSVKEVQRVFQWVEDNLGGVSVLVNSAAVLHKEPIQDLAVSQIQSLISTNVTVVMAACREAVCSMKKHGIKDGHIININGVIGHQVVNIPTCSLSAHTATKYAITAISKGLRFDVQRIPGFKIRVTSISPGFVNTDMIREDLMKDMPDKEVVLQTADVSNAIVFALSCPRSVEITELTIQATGEPV